MVQKRYTVSTKINEQENEALLKLSEQENISITAIMKLFVAALINGDIELEKGELKTCPPPHEDYVSETFEIPVYESRIEKAIDGLTEKGYPDRLKRNIEEQILESLRNMPRYDPKRMRDEPC